MRCCNSQQWGGWAETWSQRLERVGATPFDGRLHRKQLKFSMEWDSSPNSSYSFLLVNFLFLNDRYNILCVYLSVGMCVWRRGVPPVWFVNTQTHTHAHRHPWPLNMPQGTSIHSCEPSLSLTPTNMNPKQFHSYTVTSNKLQKVELGKTRPSGCLFFEDCLK